MVALSRMTELKRPEVIAEVSLHGGRDKGRIVREADTDGSIVTRTRNDTQREIDRLFHVERIDGNQHLAGTTLRDVWEAAGIGPGNLRAASLEQRIQGRHLASDYVAWDEYVLAMKQLGRDHKRIVTDVVLYDENLDAWGRKWRCLPDPMLQRALDRLAKHYEKLVRENRR